MPQLWNYLSQMAFIKGKHILDGNVIANEVIDDTKKRKNDFLMFKVDFEKAYDFIGCHTHIIFFARICFQKEHSRLLASYLVSLGHLERKQLKNF